MDVTVHSQHGHIPDSLRELVTHKMQGLPRFLSTIAAIDVEIDKDGHDTFVVRATVTSPGRTFRSRVFCHEPVAGVDVVVQRLARTLKEFKRQHSGRPLHSTRLSAKPEAEGGDDGSADSRSTGVRGATAGGPEKGREATDHQEVTDGAGGLRVTPEEALDDDPGVGRDAAEVGEQ